MQLYTKGDNKEYAIKFGVFVGYVELGVAHLVPYKAKLLLKLSDESIVELTSVENSQEEKRAISYGLFPETEELLHEIADKGIIKVRIELLHLHPENEEPEYKYRDIEFKKDEMGGQIEKWFNEINKTYNKTKDILIAEQKKTLRQILKITSNHKKRQPIPRDKLAFSLIAFLN